MKIRWRSNLNSFLSLSLVDVKLVYLYHYSITHHHQFWKKYWIASFRLSSIIHYSFLQYSLFIPRFCPVKFPSLQNSAKLLSQWPWGTKFFCKIVDILLQKLTSHCRTVLCVLRPASRIQKRISFSSFILNF